MEFIPEDDHKGPGVRLKQLSRADQSAVEKAPELLLKRVKSVVAASRPQLSR